MPRQRIRGYSRARRQQRIFYSSGKSSSKKRIRTYLERRKKKESNLPHSRALASGRFLRENLLRMKRKGISIRSSKNSLSLSLSLSLSALLFISLSLSLLCSLYRSLSLSALLFISLSDLAFSVFFLFLQHTRRAIFASQQKHRFKLRENRKKSWARTRVHRICYSFVVTSEWWKTE